MQGEQRSASSRRVYVSAAKEALRNLSKPARQCGSCRELLDLIMEGREKGAISNSVRLNPFLAFLRSKAQIRPDEDVDLEPVRDWIVTSVLHETKSSKQISLHIRRDLAMLAGLCLAPDKQSPRCWPRSAVAVTKLRSGGFKVTLWNREVGDQGLALPLLYWHYWRERLGRPEQGRLHRKQNWAFSDLLFPNSEGNAFQDQVVRDALRRVSARNKGPVGITPALIQRAFTQVRPDGSERYLG